MTCLKSGFPLSTAKMTQVWSTQPFDRPLVDYKTRIQHLEDVVQLLLAKQEPALFLSTSVAPLAGLFCSTTGSLQSPHLTSSSNYSFWLPQPVAQAFMLHTGCSTRQPTVGHNLSSTLTSLAFRPSTNIRTPGLLYVTLSTSSASGLGTK
ncbi:hypothetical protein PCASD_26840 [Puccinia coronata f. sp. avenae]|uniref:Uncharacterized protein n=1 Tax=Puccinia coronata f. sp. avenae TaxID=200324 RepID=A0A2N5RW04_9BASI|nr:hypothetical protein PCASD_26840 [Puccinia coronata f. sp. avenae]